MSETEPFVFPFEMTTCVLPDVVLKINVRLKPAFVRPDVVLNCAV